MVVGTVTSCRKRTHRASRQNRGLVTQPRPLSEV